MERVDCVVIGAGVIGLAIARQLAIVRARGPGPRGRRHDRHRDQLAQQRGDPRRHLLSDRIAQGAHLRRRQAEAVCVLRRARNPASPLRQADRGGERGAEGDARGHPRQGGGERRGRPGMAGAGGGEHARARGVLHRGPALALHRDHRQPRSDAGVPGRRRGPRRDARVSCARRARPDHGRRHRARGGRRRADDAPGRDRGQQRRPACGRSRAPAPGARPRAAADRVPVQGQLLHPRRAPARSGI